MTDKFQKAIKNRANERVQKRLSVFRGKIGDALLELDKHSYEYDEINTIKTGRAITPDALSRQYLEQLLSDDPKQKWPGGLWGKEEEVVTKEILSLLDPVQRALQAKEPGPDDCSPADKKEPAGV